MKYLRKNKDTNICTELYLFLSTDNILQDKHIYILIFERLTICPKYVTILSNNDIFYFLWLQWNGAISFFPNREISNL